MRQTTAIILSAAVLALTCTSLHAEAYQYAWTRGTTGWYDDGTNRSGIEFNDSKTQLPTTSLEVLAIPLQSSTAPGAYSSASATAGLGNLHTYLSASAEYGCAGSAQAHAEFWDHFTIMPMPGHEYLNGTTALLRANFIVDGTITGGGTYSARFNELFKIEDDNGSTKLELCSVYGSTNPNLNLTGSVSLIVGKTYLLYSLLDTSVSAGEMRPWAAAGDVVFDVSNTAHSYLWTDSSNLTISSYTGTSYAPAASVPEPACLGLAAVAVVLLGRRTRQSQA